MKLSEAGSLVNYVEANSKNPTPTVGMAATILMYTDRHPATVIEVSKSGKMVKVQKDKATRVDNNGMSDVQEYTYERNPEGHVEEYRLTKNGWRQTGGGSWLRLGSREKYHDFTF